VANIPDVDPKQTYEAGLRYIQRGWQVFLLAVDGREGKIPQRNCRDCDPRKTYHPPETCGHIHCHGFYAATGDPARWMEMVKDRPNGFLAVATGRRSKILVIDAEATRDDDGQPTGLEVLEAAWSGLAELPPTLACRSVSGGLHLFYGLPDDAGPVPSAVRFLPGIDVKADGGYVGAVGSRRTGRTWLSRNQAVAPVPTEWLGGYLSRTRSKARQRRPEAGGFRRRDPESYDFRTFFRLGCPDGFRDLFFNDLIFSLRVGGRSYADAEETVRTHWLRCAQPPEARYEMPWRHVKYKLDRIWHEVPEPESPLDRVLVEWAEAQDRSEAADGRRVGRVQLGRRP